MSRKKEKTINVEPGETLCTMLVNPNSGFASQHTRNCAASIKLEAGRFRTCEETGATRHVRIMSEGKGKRIMVCMNVLPGLRRTARRLRTRRRNRRRCCLCQQLRTIGKDRRPTEAATSANADP